MHHAPKERLSQVTGRGVMVGRVEDDEEDDVQVHARAAVGRLGGAASNLLSQHADMLFQQGDLLGAFYCRLIVDAIRALDT